ncbi:hypothetical protein ITX31_04970 [Arthrobacter gandavensis]|uniref:hypothetical protein n=1 Tax=Arthrobacter gandavensis TaxID=169960 RepID=UPI00188ED4EF|nr:hypothetical protein [Arthrobacter gandavensis]MBF4993465.1 hypothetical protein [Arthrobacter gandavensis]
MGTYNTLTRTKPVNDVLNPVSGAAAGRWILASRSPDVPAPPTLEPEQVYVTRRGTVFHSTWCQVVQRTWEFNRPALQVCGREAAGKRRLCRSCLEEARHR